jgi:membrane-associated protease RseP (regulator of RpoE activity)
MRISSWASHDAEQLALQGRVRSLQARQPGTMRRLAFLLFLCMAAACEQPDEHIRLVTVESQDRLGLSLRELPEATLKSIGLAYGLAVIRLGAAGERAGLRVGDVVHGVGETRIRNLNDFSRALAEPREGRVSLLVRRGKTDLQVPVEVGALRPESGMLRLPRAPKDTLLRT